LNDNGSSHVPTAGTHSLLLASAPTPHPLRAVVRNLKGDERIQQEQQDDATGSPCLATLLVGWVAIIYLINWILAS